MFTNLSTLKLYHKIAFFSISLMTLTLLVVSCLIFKAITEDVKKTTANQCLTIARIVAKLPAVQNGILAENPPLLLQPMIEEMRQTSGASLIVVYNMDEIRLAHPVSSALGTSGKDPMHTSVLQGQEFIYSAGKLLAPSLRANVPIITSDGKQIGFVTVGFYLEAVNNLIWTTAKEFVFSFTIGVLCCLLGSLMLARHIKSATFNLEPSEIATILKERDATLKAIREGIVAVDTDKNIKYLNQEAIKLLGLTPEQINNQSIDALLPDNNLLSVIVSGQAIYDEEQRLQDKIILSCSIPIIVDDKTVGAVLSFRDRTEVNQLAEELTGIHRLVDTLRAQAHEFKNKMHTIGGLIQLKCYQEALHYAVGNKVGMQVQMGMLHKNIKDSIIAGLLLGKESQIKELKIDFMIDPNSIVTELPVNVTSGDIVLILGNLLQNSIEAVTDCEPRSIWASIIQEASVLRIKTKNSGPWVSNDLMQEIFLPNITTKKEHAGLGLALIKQKVDLFRGSVVVRNIPSGGVEFDISIPYNWEDKYE
ncbi:MAG: sensor histidine kinase [Sporomusaceae bacterium]|nr:sensor histidine kinase [Sporomusaceae bacterium]